MKINKTYKLHKVANQTVIILQGKHGVDTTKVLQLNATSIWLWERFREVAEFTCDDVVSALVEHYHIDAKLAQRDTQQWVDALAEYNVIICD